VRASADLDAASIDMRRELVFSWRTAGLPALFAQMRAAVRDRLPQTDLMDLIGEDHLYGSAHAAAKTFIDKRALNPSGLSTEMVSEGVRAQPLQSKEEETPGEVLE
jgi:hypothetical protein